MQVKGDYKMHLAMVDRIRIFVCIGKLRDNDKLIIIRSDRQHPVEYLTF
jgi:hypothetical protein